MTRQWRCPRLAASTGVSKDGNGADSDRVESLGTQNRNLKLKPEPAPNPDSGENPSPKPKPADPRNPRINRNPKIL
jgi:hypothetical protein